jgi:phosphoglycolate phosphatase-like HAD superfamily hydrolase
MRFVLFDIDGTLLSTRGAGRRAMEAALVTHFGTAGPVDYRYDGKTDKQIARELMQGAGFSDDTIDARMSSVLAAYLTGLNDELAATPAALEVHTGVNELLDALDARRNDVVVGLLTGNIEGGAHAKLRATGLGTSRFRFGAFGSDHERRAALPAIARARAAELVGRDVRGEALVIVGDTPHDLTCGNEIGARAIGVATGYYRTEALAKHDAIAVFENLGDTMRVVDAILHA